MNLYELISEIDSSRPDKQWDNLPYSFNQLNRDKLEDALDLEVFDLIKRAYGISIIFRSDRRDGDEKLEYRTYGEEGIISFTDTELRIINPELFTA